MILDFVLKKKYMTEVSASSSIFLVWQSKIENQKSKMAGAFSYRSLARGVRGFGRRAAAGQDSADRILVC